MTAGGPARSATGAYDADGVLVVQKLSGGITQHISGRVVRELTPEGAAFAGPADGSCATAGATTVSRAFDSADRPVTGAGGQGSYVHDGLGRTTTLPAADAPRPQCGDIALAYYDNDLAKSITQGGVTTEFALDVLVSRTGNP